MKVHFLHNVELFVNLNFLNFRVIFMLIFIFFLLCFVPIINCSNHVPLTIVGWLFQLKKQ